MTYTKTNTMNTSRYGSIFPLSGVTDAEGHPPAYPYDDMGGPVIRMTLGNGIALNTTYDLNYQPIELAYSVFLDRTHGTDNVGNITEIIDNLDPGRSQGFVYDDLYRLASADGEYGTMAYTYDGVGNRKTKTINGFQEHYNYFPGTNRLSGIFNKATYAYNDNGSVTEINQTDGGPTPPPVQDKTILYHFDLAGRLIAETDQSGALIKAYVWLHNQPLAMIRNDNSICYYHNDHLGTPQRMTDETGALAWSADYYPFGKADITIELVENNLRFPGQYFDEETGLHYNWHRYYDPGIGRYLRADPIGLAGGINLFVYCLNNSLNLIDPNGNASLQMVAPFESEAQLLYEMGDWFKGLWEYTKFEISETAKARSQCLICTGECSVKKILPSYLISSGVKASLKQYAKKYANKGLKIAIKQGIPVYNVYSNVQTAAGIIDCSVDCVMKDN